MYSNLFNFRNSFIIFIIIIFLVFIFSISIFYNNSENLFNISYDSPTFKLSNIITWPIPRLFKNYL